MSSSQVLVNVDLFSDLKPSQLERVYSLCKEAVFLHGEVIFKENDPSSEFYVILEGEVAIQVNPGVITSSTENHAPELIAILYTGQSFGEVALVDQGLRSASAICHSTTCKTLKIQRDDFMHLVSKDPRLGFTVMMNLATDLCTKIRLSNFNRREGLLYSPRHQK